MTAAEPSAAELRRELETSRRQLLENYKMASLGRLLAGIVHEINSPIGSILSNNQVSVRSLELLQDALREAQASGSAPSDKALDIVETLSGLASVDKIACARIASVIRGLKTFSRVDDSELRKVDIHEVLSDALRLTGCEFRRRIAVEVDFAELPEVECHPQLMNQVFVNLLINAAQAICGEGKVAVSTRLEDGWAHIAISDTGCGIKPEDQAKIFTQGFSTKPLGIGTGLGLSICKQIVEESHRGRLEFDSEPEVGTTFHIRIPVLQEKNRAE
ncbi:MAG TPA: ATP-binding protein [Acidobacteriota bacterium]|jgi:two-component system NtrC family sensor kinase